MSRRLMIAGNWKMNLTLAESLDLAGAVAAGLKRDDLDVLLAPTALAVAPLAQSLAESPVLVSGQNLYWEDGGAYTGELGGPLLAAAGASHVIIGHSERRQYFGETEKTANLRMAAAFRANLTPILCVGETIEEARGRTHRGGAGEPVVRSPGRLRPERGHGDHPGLRAGLGHRYRHDRQRRTGQ